MTGAVKMLARIAGHMYLIWMVVNFGFSSEYFSQNVATFSMIRPVMVMQNLIVAVAVVTIALTLLKLHPIFGWWIGRLVKSKSEHRANWIFAPMRIPYVKYAYAGALIFSLPTLAWIEEIIFRQGTDDWKSAVLRSVIFGLCHCLMGVPLAAGIALCIPGLWYSFQYFQGGTTLSTVHHTTYNLIVIGVVIIIVMLGKQINDDSEAKEESV